MMRPRPGARCVRGFSLIELMISLTIGLLITVAAFSAFMGASGASKMAEAQGRMNEDAQAALSILTQQLRMAGNNPDQPNRVDNINPALSSRRNPVYLQSPPLTGFTLLPTTFELSEFSIRGCDGQFSNITTASNLDALTCASGTSTSPDSIAVSYEADKFNTVPTGTNEPTDCLGNPLSTITATLPTVVGAVIANTAEPYTVADNRFYIVKSSASSIPSLYCKGSGGEPQPLVENIEDMQFTYGATATATTVAGYLNAEKVLTEITLTPSPPNPEAGKWAKVLTVRICVLVRSASPVASNAASAHYIKCDGTLETAPPDLRLRRAYSTTVVLRNRIALP